MRNINLRAPRRFGKTSLMNHILGNSEKIAGNILPLYIDLEKIDSPAKFAAVLCVQIRRHIDISEVLPCMCRAHEAEVVAEIKNLAERWKESWEEAMKETLDAAERSGRNLLLLLDEITLMLGFFEDARHSISGFLDCFEKRRRDSTRTRFLFAASSSVEVFLKSRELEGYFQDCEHVSLDFFSEELSLLFIESLLYGMEIYPSHQVIKEILNLSFPTVPYFTQVFIGQVAAFHRRKGRPPDAHELVHIYEDEVTGPDCRRYFDQFVDRLDCNEGDPKAVKGLLSELSRTKEGMSRTAARTFLQGHKVAEQAIERIFNSLEFDFYIEDTQNSLRFANPILREYWRKNR